MVGICGGPYCFKTKSIKNLRVNNDRITHQVDNQSRQMACTARDCQNDELLRFSRRIILRDESPWFPK